MKKSLLVTAALLAAMGAAQATNVGVSIDISQPGVHGRIDIGRFPHPEVVVAQPVWGHAPPRMVVAQPVEPVYLWVPPGHRKHWRQHCARYNACGVPVMFVQDRWYQEHAYRPHAAHAPQYAPQYAPPPPAYRDQDLRREPDGRGRGHDNGHGRGHDRGQGGERRKD